MTKTTKYFNKNSCWFHLTLPFLSYVYKGSMYVPECYLGLFSSTESSAHLLLPIKVFTSYTRVVLRNLYLQNESWEEKLCLYCFLPQLVLLLGLWNMVACVNLVSLCLYIYLCLCVHLCMCAFICLCMYVCKSISICSSVRVCISVCLCICLFVYLCLYAYLCTCIFVCACISSCV